MEYYGYVTVPHASYAQFRAAVLNNGYNVDYLYGCQCYDMALLFWNNVGFPQGYPLSTGIGANGIWDRRSENVSYGGTTYFSLVTSLNDIKRGDILIYNTSASTAFGHIGFADEDYDTWHASHPTSYEFPILSENNGGTPDPDGGRWTDVHGYDTRYFQGAFRYIPWAPTPPPPTPTRKHKFPWFIYANRLRNKNNYGII